MIRLGVRLLFAIGFTLGASTLMATAASAQATRTWVSGVGDDANPCSRTAPCKTFAGAISKTAASGEINCLDPGGWGAVTITKSLTIDCDQFPGGILNSGSSGITVNAGATDIVTIRGLEINGAPITSPGLNGIKFNTGGALIVEHVVIRGNNAASPNGAGILFAPSGASKLTVINTTISGNGSGIKIQPVGASGSAIVSLRTTRAVNNAGNGLTINTTGNTAAAGNQIDIVDSQFDSNGGTGISVNQPASTAVVLVMVRASSISGNVNGIFTNGPQTIVRVGNSTIAHNVSVGVQATGAGAGLGILSYTPATNQMNDNGTDGTFSGTVALR